MKITAAVSAILSRITNRQAPRFSAFRTENALFLLLLAPELLLTLYLIFERRMIGGHDGFQYCTLQYYFLNNAVLYGDVPQWIPFLTHGTVAAPWYFIQAGFLQNALLLFAPLLKNVHFLTLFDLGILIDSLLLLAGTWLLARRFFPSPLTAFFISVSVMGSAIWPAQVWWNFHLFYALPLILHFLHVFLEKGEWRYFSLAGSLAAAQAAGNLPYYLPLLTLVLFHYFLFYFLLNRKEIQAHLARLKFGLPFAASLLLTLTLFLTVFVLLKSGTGELVYSLIDSGRSASGINTLHTFMNYGGRMNLSEWLELFLRVSPDLDYGLYAGLGTLPFILWGALNTRRENAHWILTVLTMGLFVSGTFIAAFFYYAWPMMKYYRHLALAAPLLRFFLCFLAGIGFEALLQNRAGAKKPLSLILAALIAVLMLGIAAGLRYASLNPAALIPLLKNMGPANLLKFLPLIENSALLASRLKIAAGLAFLFAALFAPAALLPGLKKTRGLILLALLALHFADLYEYKFFEISQKTVRLTEDQYQATYFRKFPYLVRRILNDEGTSNRKAVFKNFPAYGATYWANQAFLFQDRIWSDLRTDTWLRPVDLFMRAYWHQNAGDLNAPPPGLHVYFSRETVPGSPHPAAAKITGFSDDKIRFFSGVYSVAEADSGSETDWISSLMINPKYSGNMIFVSPPENRPGPDLKIPHWTLQAPLELDRSIPLRYQVVDFDSNRLEVAVSVPQGLESAWMFYSDAWHPFWKATVNGQPAPVLKANLAYKAVPLQPGPNLVRFRFHSGLLSFLQFILGMNSLFWVSAILLLAARLVRERSLSES